MKRVVVVGFVCLASGLFLACPGDETSGGPSGDLVCDDGTQTQRACPGLGSTGRATALETLQAWDQSVKRKFSNARWLGGIQGYYIGRDGRLLEEDFPIGEILGMPIPSSTTWQCNFCNPDGEVPQEMVHFATVAGGTCGAVMQCQTVNCGVVEERTFPTVDSPEAIAIAFPDDPADTVYGVTLVLDLGNHWAVNRMDVRDQVPASVKVDAFTGDILP